MMTSRFFCFIRVVHFWQNRDLGAWSIPKCEHSRNEPSDIAARREFAEETGWPPLSELRSLVQVVNAVASSLRPWR
ncbi:NUDIX domain-containing protein [Rhizobium sp. CNPSo 3968]|uniref:NUDIX domain-containing protein n=1 Tax=Rhizobium sp. CNPSo 3968 TaxID=3021408 RepID=UPI003305F2D3